MTLAVPNIALEEKIGTNIFNENHLNPRNIVTPQSPMTTTTQTLKLEQTSQPFPSSESNPQPLKFSKKDSEVSTCPLKTNRQRY